MLKELLSKGRTNFITGLVVILPTVITLVILKWLLAKVNVWFLDPFIGWVRPYVESHFMLFILKSLLLVFLITFVILCGAATRIIFIRRFFGVGEQLLSKMPLVSKIYVVTKEVSKALFGKKKGLFRKVVLVEFPRQGLLSVAFVTCEHIDKNKIKKPIDDDIISVFIPTSPNPTTGAFVFVKKRDIVDVDMTVEDAIKLVLSGGAIFPLGKTGRAPEA